MAKIYTPEELGLRSQKASYTPEELGLTPSAPKEKPQSTGLAAALKSGTYNLNANIWEGVGRTGDYVYKSLGKEPRYEKGLTSIAKWVKDSRKASEAIGYKPEYKVADVIKDPTKAVPYVLEKLAESAPEMAMFASPVAWGPVAIGKANDNLDTILKNDGRTLKDATFGDVSKAISIAGAQTALGATQVNRLMGLGSAKAVPGTTKLQRVSTEAQAQMLLEAGDELLGYVGTHAGTKKGIKPDEAQEVILGSALVGGPLGGVSKGVAEAVAPQFKKPEEALSTEILPEPTQEETVEPSEPQVSQQAQPVEAQVQQLMDNFGLSEPEARDVIANENQQTQATPESIAPEVVPQEPASELDTALSNPAVQAGLQEANASIEALGPMSGPDTESAIKRASVQNALVESGTPINEARKLVDILEANNYEISRSGTNVGRVEPSVPMPDEGTVSAGEPDGFGRIDLGRNIEPTPVPPGGDVTQHNPLGETNVQTPIEPQAPFGIEPAQNFAPLEPSVQQGPEPVPPAIEPVEEVPPLAQPQEAQFQPQQEPILPNIEAAQASEAPIDLGRNIEPTESVPLQAAPQEGAFDLGANIEPKEVSSAENPLVQGDKTKEIGFGEYIEFNNKTFPTRNSNGDYIHGTKEGIENFWKWFDGSNAVDSEGRPLILYHGTDKEFDTFGDNADVKGWRNSIGTDGYFFFTPSYDLAKRYAEDLAEDIKDARVLPVYLSITNPMIVDSEGVRGRKEDDLIHKALMDSVEQRNDSVMILNAEDPPIRGKTIGSKEHTLYVAKYRKQIKSISNSGAYDVKSESLSDKKIPKKAKKPRKSIEQLKREKAAFQADQKDRNQRLKALNKIRSFLNKTLDVDAFPSPEMAFFAGKSLLAHKKGFLDLVQNIANTPKYKGTEVGRRANKILSNLSDKERVDVKARAKDFLKDKDAVKLAIKFPKSVRNNPNPEYNKFKSATQAVGWLKDNGTDFEKDLVKKLLPHLRGIGVEVVDSVADNLTTKFNLPKGTKIAAAYVERKDSRKIYLDVAEGVNNASFLHEALHAATMARLNNYYDAVDKGKPVDKQTREAVTDLENILQDAKAKADKLTAMDFRAYGMSKAQIDNMLSDVHELVSYGMTTPALQAFLMDTPSGISKSALRRLFNDFVRAIRKLFGLPVKYTDSFHDLIDVTDTMLAMEPETEVSVPSLAMMRKVSDDIDKDISKLDAAQSSSEVSKSIFNMAKQGHNFSDYAEALEARFDAFSEKSLKPLLYTLQTDDIVRWKGDEIAPITRINDLSRKVSGMRTRLHGKANELAEEFTRFVRNNGNKTISDAMHIARLQEISFAKNPTLNEALSNDWIVKEQEAIINDPKTTQSSIDKATIELQKRKDNLTRAYKIWGDLGRQKGGQDMYRKIQGYYASYMRSRRYYLDKRLEGMDMEKSAKKNLIASIRTMYETAAKNSGDYFPLMRHGDYWLRVKKGPDEAKGFYKFDSPEDRNTFLDKVAKQHGLDKDDSDVFSVGVHEDQVFDAMRQNSKMLREMFSAIDKADSKNKEALKDEIFQVYLHTMPEASMRRQFIHPDKVTGFSGDVLRNFKSYSMKAGNELARLAYNDQIENEIASGYAALEGAPTLEQGKLKLFVDEMASRAREELNPLPENNVVSKINQFTFLWLLTSASSAAIQMVSVPVMVLPTLMARFGTAPASAKFAKYSNFLQALSGKVNTYEDGTKTIVWPTIKESKIAKDNPMLLKAINEATDDYNLFQSTNVSVLTDRNKTPEKVSDNVAAQAARKTYNIMTAMFNGSERISRELTFGMTFELEYAKTKSYDKAKEAAIKAVDELLGRYDNANRPRVFRNALMKNIGQFKQYSIVMTSFWMRNMYNALKGEDAATRMFAIERMVGTSLMGAMFHGILGSPFYHATALTLDAILNADEEDKKERIKKNPLTAESSDLRFRYEYLPNTFGHIKVPNASGREIPLNTVLERGPISALTDMNFGSKTSHDITSLWFRDAKPGANWAETAQNMLIANLGPTVSTSFNAIGGMQDLYDGKVLRGLEKIAPAFVKGFPMAYRLKTEGAETKTNKDILRKDEIDTINLIGSVTGLQPTRLTRLQDRNFRFQSEIIKANGEKSKLLNKLNSAIYDEDSPDKSAIKDVYKDIVKHNERYPMEGMYIDYETIERSTNSYADRKMKTYRGLQVNDAVLPYMAKILKMSQP